jgi:hypothetical protein
MARSNILRFGENTATMTYGEGLAFIERTRRQLDRFDTALAGGNASPFPPEEAAALRTELDALEASLRKDLGSI